jgi:hypothetical protein
VTPYLTPQERRRQKAALLRLPATDAERVEAMDNITAIHRNPATRPPDVAEVHDRYANDLTKETP